MPRRAAVVGAGIAGLAAAHALATNGWDVTVFETSGRVGGRIASRVVDGCLFESGPDGFFAATNSIDRLVDALGLAADVVEPRPGWAGLVRDGSIVPMPAHLWNGIPYLAREVLRTPVLAPRERLRLLGEPLVGRRSIDGESLEALLVRRIGRGAAAHLVGPLLAGVHAGRAAELEAASVAPGLVATERGGGSWLRAARRSEAGRSGSGRPLRSFARGMSQLSDALAASLVSRGVALRFGGQVDGLRREADAWCVEPDGVAFDAAVLAVPPSGLSALLAGELPDAATIAGSQEVAGVVLVHLRTEAPLPFRYRTLHGAIVPADEPGPMSALTLPSQKWPGRAAGSTLTIRVSLREGADPGGVPGAVARLLRLPATPDVLDVEAQPEAFPVMRMGHAARVAAFRAAVARAPGLAVVGGAWDGVGLGALIAAAATAAASLDGRPAPAHGEPARS